MEYRCLRCEYRFCSENGIPYCPACDCESLEEIKKYKLKELEAIKKLEQDTLRKLKKKN